MIKIRDTEKRITMEKKRGGRVKKEEEEEEVVWATLQNKRRLNGNRSNDCMMP